MGSIVILIDFCIDIVVLELKCKSFRVVVFVKEYRCGYFVGVFLFFRLFFFFS